jgi:sulfur carrier protein
LIIVFGSLIIRVMKLTINGQEMELSDGTGLCAMLDGCGLSEKRVAVELNRRIIPREQYAATQLGEGDTLEIISFVGGG